jgi:hypothetical protein
VLPAVRRQWPRVRSAAAGTRADQDHDACDHLDHDVDGHGDEQHERRADGPGGGSGHIAGAGRLPCGVDRVASEVPAPVAPRAVRHLAAAAFASLGALRRGVGRAGSI